VRLKFSDLFEGIGSAELCYCQDICTALSGQEVELAGWLSLAHPGTGRVMLVSEPGVCPDCSPLPVPCLDLPGFVPPRGPSAVRLRGRLSYGFQCDADGTASFLRLEQAKIATGISA
jgi:hypothetical protein